MGRARTDYGPDLRSVPLGRYLLFYKPVEGGIEFIRLIHGSRDLGSIDFD